MKSWEIRVDMNEDGVPNLSLGSRFAGSGLEACRPIRKPERAFKTSYSIMYPGNVVSK